MLILYPMQNILSTGTKDRSFCETFHKDPTAQSANLINDQDQL